jgi:hypothetical protein
MSLKFNFSQITKSGNNNAKPQDCDYDGIAVTPSDSVDLPNGVSYGFYATGSGNVTVNIDGAATRTAVVTVPANALVLVPCARILATGTTATGIYAVY